MAADQQAPPRDEESSLESSQSSAAGSESTRNDEPTVILEEGDLEAASHTTATIVDFDGKDDPSDPRNWSLRYAGSTWREEYSLMSLLSLDTNGLSQL